MEQTQQSQRGIRRTFAAGGALLVAITALTACAGSGDAGDSVADDSITIVWESGGKAALDVMIEEFEKANPGVTVEPEYLDAGAIKTQIPTRLAAGTAPDLFRTEAGRGTTIAVQYLAAKNYLAEISGDNTKDVPEFVTQTLSLDGKVYGYTPVLAGVGQVINDDALQEAGLEVPTTWDDVLQFCRDARDAGTIAYANGPVTPHENQTIPYALAGELVYGPSPDLDQQLADGKTTFPDSGWREAIQGELDMIEAGCFPDSFEGNDMMSVIDSISTGKTIGMVGYTAYLPYATGATSSFSLAPLPGSADPDESRLLVAPFASFGINAAGNVGLAQRFVDFVASPEMSRLYSDTVSPGGGLLTSSYAQQTDYPEDQIGQTMVEYLDSGRTISFPDAFWRNPQVQVALQTGLQEAIQGNMSVDDVLAGMQDAFDLDTQ